VRIYYITQAKIAPPPTFLIFTNQKAPLHFSYQRFLENQLRGQPDCPSFPASKIMSSLDIAIGCGPRTAARGRGERQPIGPARLDAARAARRKSRHPHSRFPRHGQVARYPRPQSGEAEAIKRAARESTKAFCSSRGRTALRQNDDALLGDQSDQGEGVNIVTVEDPVGYRMQGIVQVQVQEKAAFTFAAALRSILRQDPNVVLVGEIRDKETAQIAVQASLTDTSCSRRCTRTTRPMPSRDSSISA